MTFEHWKFPTKIEIFGFSRKTGRYGSMSCWATVCWSGWSLPLLDEVRALSFTSVSTTPYFTYIVAGSHLTLALVFFSFFFFMPSTCLILWTLETVTPYIFLLH